MPKAVCHRSVAEIEYYRAFFDNVRIWINDVESIVRIAQEESERCGLAAMDALHVATAHLAEASVLYTLERSEKPIHRTTLVHLVWVGPAEEPLA